MNNLETLASLGLDITPFGGNTFLFSSIPSDLKEKNIATLLKDLVDELTSNELSRDNNNHRVEQILEKE